MRNRIALIIGGLLAVALTRNATAGPSGVDELIVIDHQPNQIGGLSSDTELTTMFGNPAWQRGADDFTLITSAEIGAIRWWGFYDLDNPPAQETFRIRFYGARPLDGLPDDANIAFEHTVDNPMRISTGRTVFVGVDPDEYVYELEFLSSIFLQSNTLYWLEITQLGDLNTHFRWEFSQSDSNAQAFINATTVDWRLSLPVTADTAFQLIAVPEPTASGLFVLATAIAILRRKRGAIM